jgi:AraC-like DNA-binding protein
MWELLTVAQVEERHGVSDRTLQRWFARYVGVGPKWVLARYRLHDVVTELDQGHAGPLADVAARHGWYDQSHFVRDFRSLTGVTPGEYAARVGQRGQAGPSGNTAT